MQTSITDGAVVLWLSARDTADWAHGVRDWEGKGVWHCSALSGKRLCAIFDAQGLVGMTINGRHDFPDVSASEFNAITSDFLAQVLPVGHPAYFAVVGQFREEARS